ncbi:hypothetical protein [Vibrio rhizosphaerae]|uniref:Uncharacterized protein n=1 Tax=Vibrio rhizosphaerae TaxID=398736 RepID=A0ABU4IX07_9VIBR|nr:hypothetical protein [Vibrio rhizosphaerae]MDW6093939.1 hypothetical protein [Vibrio rhizosphaerae]
MGERELSRIGFIVYWLGCLVVFAYLLNHDWQQFYDSFSLICTFVPAICSLFLRKNESIDKKCLRFIKVNWISAGSTTVYGIILSMSYIPFDPEGLVVGFSVAILPIFYAFTATLVLAPFVTEKH